MTADIDPQEFGRLQAQVAALRQSEERTALALEAMVKSLQAIEIQLAEARGGWRTLLMVGGAAGTAGAVVTKLVIWASKVAPQ